MSDMLLVDKPAPFVLRLTINRPEKRNALSNELRGALFSALDEADRDDAIRVCIIRGAGSCFSAGYDLSAEGAKQPLPFQSAAGAGMSWKAASGSGTWRNPSSPRCMDGVLQVDRNSQPPAISSMSPKMPGSAIRRCA